MDDDPLHRSISYLLASSMRPLAVVSDITARLAEGGELVVTVGDVMQQLQQALGATEVSLWLHASDGLRRSAAAGDPSLSVDEVRRAVEQNGTNGVIARRLVAMGQRVGVLAVRGGSSLTEDAREVLAIVANLLAPEL